MDVLSDDKRAMILRALCEGDSIRAIARLVGVVKRTVSNLLRDVRSHAKNYHHRFVTDVQADEIWSFVGCKERRVPKDGPGHGFDLSRRAEEPDDAHVHASVHAPDERLLQGA